MDLIKDKEFIELTAVERTEINELCASEDEFNHMKSMLNGISALNWSNPAPKTETKERLDMLFQQTYPKAAPVWYSSTLAVVVPKDRPIYRQPLVQIAAVGLLLLLAYPFVNNMIDSNKDQLALVEKKTEVREKPAASEQKNMETTKSTEVDEAPESVPSTSSAPSRSVDVHTIDVPELVSSRAGALPPPSLGSADKDRRDEDLAITSFSSTSPATQPGSNHPDGIFIGDRVDIFSAPASHQPAVFDLLTSTF